MTTYYRNEYLFSEIYLQEITQQPEDTEILASLTTLKEYREFAYDNLHNKSDYPEVRYIFKIINGKSGERRHILPSRRWIGKWL